MWHHMRKILTGFKQLFSKAGGLTSKSLIHLVIPHGCCFRSRYNSCWWYHKAANPFDLKWLCRVHFPKKKKCHVLSQSVVWLCNPHVWFSRSLCPFLFVHPYSDVWYSRMLHQPLCFFWILCDMLHNLLNTTWCFECNWPHLYISQQTIMM